MNNENSIFSALSDPTRRKIIAHLKQQDMTPCELSGLFTISKPSMSHHLDSLKRANLVITERVGQKIVYSLNVTVFDDLINSIFDLFNVSNTRSKE